MCGIICEISYSGCSVLEESISHCSSCYRKHNRIKFSLANVLQIQDKVLQRIKNRGPDCIGTVEIKLDEGVKATFSGAVLRTRGPGVVPQPIENKHGVLLYNGDIFDEAWDQRASDTLLIMEKLSAQKKSSEIQIIQELKSLRGPFSIIYYDKKSHNLYFLRDRIGRSSLLFHKSEKAIVIGSVLGRKYQCIEVPAMYIHVLNIKNNEIRRYAWTGDAKEIDARHVQDWLAAVEKLQSLPDEQFACESDCAVDLNDQVDVVQYIKDAARKHNSKSMLMKELSENDTIGETVSKITQLLQNSIRVRLEAQPSKCERCSSESPAGCGHCAVAVLFSGGLDCTVLAFIAHKYLPEEQCIELINVAFKKEDKASYDVPDRLTGRRSLQELKRLCPSRKWVFREINVPKEELEEFQISTIADLVYPRCTVLDESLGSALWFAARGQDESSASSCRVLLLGSGADELFGGYARHRGAFARAGWRGLHRELRLDWSRISLRNLARDNRVLCDHGRQPRMPYLDEELTEFVLLLKPWLKCFPSDSLGPGVGDKLMLRLVAFSLGLTEVATFPKRALQFGSRVANSKERGADVSKTFKQINISD